MHIDLPKDQYCVQCPIHELKRDDETLIIYGLIINVVSFRQLM